MHTNVTDKSPTPPEPVDEDPAHGSVVDNPLPTPPEYEPTVQSPVTDSGLPVEEQIRKEWDPKKDGGLPTPLAAKAKRRSRR